MRKIVIGIIAIFFVLILAAAIIPFLIPSSVYKSSIQEQLSSRLNRTVVIDGDVKISPFPSLKIKMDDVTIANPEGFSENNFARMEALNVRVKLLPLISKRIEIVSFELDQPMISLKKNASGDSNWVLGGGEAQNNSNTGPFKRDGRYADIDATIGQFSIRGGSISFEDQTNNRSHNFEKVDLDFSMASLADPVKASGSMTADGIPADFSLSLNTPKSFLQGQKTPIELTLETGLGDVTAKGFFTESQDIHFALDMDGILEDLAPLSSLIPDTAILELAKSVKFNGNYRYNGQSLEARNAQIEIAGPLLQSTFTGGGVFADKLAATGKLDLNIINLPNLAKTLKMDLPGDDAITSAKINTNLKFDGKETIADELKATIKGAGLDADFEGAGRFGEAQNISGRFSTNIASIPSLAQKFDVINPQLAALGDANASGQFSYDGKDFDVVFDQAKTRGDNLEGQYQGSVKMVDGKVLLDGDFESRIIDPKTLAINLGNSSPYAGAIGQLAAKGKISGTPENLNIEDLDMDMTNGHLNGRYDGSMSYDGKDFALTGSFDGDVPDLQMLSQVTGQELPYAQSIGRVKTSGDFETLAGKVSMKSLIIDLSGGELNGQFKGTATIDDGFQLDGDLNADVPSARKLTRSTTGVELPASTNAGEIYERVTLSGRVTGNPSQLQFKSADIALDAITGNGEFILDLTDRKPNLKGTLDMGQIDFRPYTEAYTAPYKGKGLQPWSEVPFNLTALKVMDGDYVIKTPEVIFGPLTFGQTDLNATVTNGVMTARLPEINLYGGLGVLTATLDASSDIPKVKLAVTLEDIRSNRFLGSISNFTQLEGQGHTVLELSGEGRTQGEIMRSLDGYGDFEVIGGVIKGIDLSKLLTGIDETLTQRVLPTGIGSKYATKFDDMIGKFKIQDGVISIDSLNLKALDVLASGSGRLDIGNQNVDFSLRPRLTGTNAGDIGRFGVPIRFKGPWGQISPGPDFDFLKKIAVEKAKIKAEEEIRGRVGDGVGNVLGGILGVPERDPSTPETETGSKTETEAEVSTPQTEQPIISPKEPDNSVNEGDVSEQQQNSEQPSEPKPEETEPPKEKDLEEKILDKALDGLFGNKKD